MLRIQKGTIILTTTDIVDSKKFEHGCRIIYAGFASLLGFGVGGRACSNFLASTVYALISQSVTSRSSTHQTMINAPASLRLGIVRYSKPCSTRSPQLLVQIYSDKLGSPKRPLFGRLLMKFMWVESTTYKNTRPKLEQQLELKSCFSRLA